MVASTLTSRSSSADRQDADGALDTGVHRSDRAIGTDLEKAETEKTQASRASSFPRASRTQTLRHRRTKFSHPLSEQKTGQDVLVDFEGPDDPYRPINWPMRKKIITTFLYSLTTMGSTWGSATFAPAVGQVAEQFHVAQVVTTLGISFFLLGFGLGPLVFAPLSEAFGRKPAVLIPYFLYMIFSFATAVSKDLQTVLITRFFAGLFGSAPITNSGGVMGDIWPASQRGNAMVFYASAIIAGPLISPLVGAAIVTSHLRWRWTEYTTGILTVAILTLDVLILDETYAPRLLVAKARRLRYETGNWALHAKFEEWDVSVKELAHKFGVRPFQMLMTPICFSVAFYASFVYGIVYANLASFPIIFQEGRGWNPVVGSLPFLSIFVGMIIGSIANILGQQYYNRRTAQNGGVTVPEARLPPMMFGSICFASGMFILAWTSPRQYPWIAPIIGATLLGMGFFTIFQAALNYLVDTFKTYAASAIAANTFLRSCFALSLPIAIDPMYHRLGTPWATSIFAFCAAGCIPIPFLFFIYGARIRAKGKYSANMG